jgi:O-acetyl-ADP-ribose deacetylase (regulator of RNase III)
MADILEVNGRKLRLVKGDITDLEFESFVYYARHDLALGSGFGTAIAQRGGPEVQGELKRLGSLQTTDVVVTSAGGMKAKYIIHAVGPRFQEEDLENKLRTTIRNSLKTAEDSGIRQVAFPPMGAGFYGVPLETSAKLTLETIRDHLSGDAKLTDVAVCLLDDRELKLFRECFASLGNA